MPEVRIDCARITDWPSFHTVFAEAFGFPSLYGRNMNAWVDCLTSLDCPEDGLTSVHCRPPEVLTLVLDRAELLSAEILGAVLDCGAFVNWRRLEVGEPAVLAIACWRKG